MCQLMEVEQGMNTMPMMPYMMPCIFYSLMSCLSPPHSTDRSAGWSVHSAALRIDCVPLEIRMPACAMRMKYRNLWHNRLQRCDRLQPAICFLDARTREREVL